MQHFRCNFFIRRKMTVERCKTNLHPLLLEYVSEAAFWQTPVKRHLTAFKPDLTRITGTRFLALFPARSGFAHSRSGSSANSLFLVSRAFRRPKTIKTDSHYSLRQST